MKKQFAVIIISALTILPLSVNAQNENNCANSNFFCNDLKSCEEKIKAELRCKETDFSFLFGKCDFSDFPSKPSCSLKDESFEDEDKSENEVENPDNDVIQDEVPANDDIQTLFELVNAEREKNGISPLTYDHALEECAAVRSKEISVTFSHTRPSGQSCFTVLDEKGYSYSYAGENLAYGQTTPEEVFSAWMNSEGHRKNILSPNYTNVGMSKFDSSSTYWSQFFAG